MSYTKGDWLVRRYGVTYQIYVDTPEKPRAMEHQVAKHIYNKANAHLIAQSPRMVEWIKKIAVTQHGYAYQEDVDEAIKILAKAEGK